MLGFLRRWFGGDGGEVERLRLEVEALKASAAVPFVASGGGLPFPEAPRLAQAREQERHLTGWVYAAVRPIAQRIAGQPIRLARKVKKPSGSKAVDLDRCQPWLKTAAGTAGLELVERHPILDAISDPNEVMVGWSLLYVTAVSLELTGKAFWWLIEGDRPQIWPLPASWVEPQSSEGRLFGKYIVRPRFTTESFEVSGDDMLRCYYPDPSDPLQALSPLQCVARAVACDESLEESQRRSFLNGIHPSVLLTVGRHPDINGQPGQRPHLTEAQRRQIIASIRAYYRGVVNFDEPLILDGLIESAVPFSMAPAEMGFLDSSRLTKSRIAQGFGVNPIIMGEIEGANRASAAVAETLFVNGTVNPKIALISQVLTAWIAPRFGADLVLFLEPAVATDPEEHRADAEQLCKFGCLTRNELRAWHGLAPLKASEGGDELIRPPGPAVGQEGGTSRGYFPRLVENRNGTAH